ncbi:MAG: DUF6064 family protein [Gemmatimonadota bacterium]
MNRIPFTSEQFFGVFAAYNQSIGWGTFLVYGGAAALVFSSLRATRWSSRTVCVGLAALWLWTGTYYHLVHFTAVSPAAYLFGALFIIQALLFVHAAITNDLDFAPSSRRARAAGAGLIAYALVFYPAFGIALGERYPALPLFAAPCPLTIFTFGMLFWTKRRVPIRLLAVPVVWSLIGSAAIAEFGVVQDAAMPVAALMTILLVVRRTTSNGRNRPMPHGHLGGRIA